MLLRENKSLASAILDLGEQIQKMKQMLQDFCQNYVPINNPQSEVEARIDEFLTDARNVCNRGSAETLQSAAASPSQCFLSISAEGPIFSYTPPPHTPAPPTPAEPTHPSTPPPLHTAVLLPSTGSIQPPPSPLLPHPSSPTFANVLGGRADKPQSAAAVQNEEADFTVVDRKKKIKVSKERHESKQQAQRGTGVNIDCRWAPLAIAKLWVSLPKQGALSENHKNH